MRCCMKKIYEKIEIELIYFSEDIVTQSIEKDDVEDDIFEPID